MPNYLTSADQLDNFLNFDFWGPKIVKFVGQFCVMYERSIKISYVLKIKKQQLLNIVPFYGNTINVDHKKQFFLHFPKNYNFLEINAALKLGRI